MQELTSSDSSSSGSDADGLPPLEPLGSSDGDGEPEDVAAARGALSAASATGVHAAMLAAAAADVQSCVVCGITSDKDPSTRVLFVWRVCCFCFCAGFQKSGCG